MNVGNVDYKAFVQELNRAQASMTASTGVAKECLNSMQESKAKMNKSLNAYQSAISKKTSFLSRLIDAIARVFAFILSPVFYVISYACSKAKSSNVINSKGNVNTTENKQ